VRLATTKMRRGVEASIGDLLGTVG
jgi:hypothetical protein